MSYNRVFHSFIIVTDVDAERLDGLYALQDFYLGVGGQFLRRDVARALETDGLERLEFLDGLFRDGIENFFGKLTVNEMEF